jgi:hypothetical protein
VCLASAAEYSKNSLHKLSSGLNLLNLHALEHSEFFERIFPSDTGSVISVESSKLPITSVRGDYSDGFNGFFKFSVRYGNGVRVFNPISALWNGIHTPTARILKISIDFAKPIIDSNAQSISMRFKWKQNRPIFNLISHGRSKTFVEGALQNLNAVLPQTCPDCKQWVHVEDVSKSVDKTIFNVTSDVGIEWTAFDCDNTQQLITPFIKTLQTGRFFNYG